MPHKLPCVIVSTEDGRWTHQSVSPLIYVVTAPCTDYIYWSLSFSLYSVQKWRHKITLVKSTQY